MKNRLKTKLCAIAAAACLLLGPFSQAYTEPFTTGKEWRERMTPKEKLMAVLAPMILLHRFGVPIQRSPENYVVTIDRVILGNPYLEKEDVANIFASTVYAYEPQTRPYLDAIERFSRMRPKL